MHINITTNPLFAAQRAAQTSPSEQRQNNPSFAAVMAGEVQRASNAGATSAPSAPTTAAAKYDFTYMTPVQLQETVNGLIQSGQMDLDESSSLLGMMPPSALSKVNYDAAAPAYSNAPVDFLAKIQTAIATATSRNEHSTVAGLQKAAEALARLQGQSVDVRA